MKKHFEREGSFWWTLGTLFILVGVLIMFNKEETSELEKGFEYLMGNWGTHEKEGNVQDASI